MAGWWLHKCCRRNRCFLLTGFVVVAVVLFWWTRSVPVVIIRVPAKLPGEKLVLVWTKFFRQTNWVTNEHFHDNCAVNACRVTEDKSLVLESDAVLFHERDIGGRTELPAVRTPDQTWIWLTQETVINLESSLSEYNGLFNWTMTYRRDSDLVIPYGAVRKRAHPMSQERFRRSIQEESAKRTKLAAIRISNCKTETTDRLNYARKLQRYINVDVLGACGESCKHHDNCNHAFMRQYKFYLAFENSHCRDYITEKLWLPLEFWHNVPVVMGASGPADYEAVAPPHSYIHVDRFKSPKELADYLTLLDTNDSLYNQYFEWRLTHQYSFPGYCDLCAALHDQNRQSMPHKSYDLVEWYNSDNCSAKHPIYVFTPFQ